MSLTTAMVVLHATLAWALMPMKPPSWHCRGLGWPLCHLAASLSPPSTTSPSQSAASTSSDCESSSAHLRLDLLPVHASIRSLSRPACAWHSVESAART